MISRRSLLKAGAFAFTLSAFGRVQAVAADQPQQHAGAMQPPFEKSASPDDIKEHPTCPHCGMDRYQFARSRMLVNYADGTSVGTCSIRCAAVELAGSLDKMPSGLFAADRHSGMLVEADKAFWVVTEDAPGVMTKRGKWAFATEEGRERLIGKMGGRKLTFDEAMEMAYVDLWRDTNMIRKRREEKRKPKA